MNKIDMVLVLETFECQSMIIFYRRYNLDNNRADPAEE